MRSFAMTLAGLLAPIWFASAGLAQDAAPKSASEQTPFDLDAAQTEAKEAADAASNVSFQAEKLETVVNNLAAIVEGSAAKTKRCPKPPQANDFSDAFSSEFTPSNRSAASPPAVSNDYFN